MVCFILLKATLDPNKYEHSIYDKDVDINKLCRINRVAIQSRKINLNPCFIPHVKINSMWIVNLNVKGKPIKILKDNKENVLMNLHRQKFLEQNTKSTNYKGKNLIH